MQQGIGKPSVYHAVVVIFLEFFAWGLLTTPMLTVSLFFSTNRLPFWLILLYYLLMISVCFGLGSTRNVPAAHVPDEWPHSGSEGEVDEGCDLF